MKIKKIKNHEGYYISENGEVFRKLKGSKTNSGYVDYKILSKHESAHRLVAEHYLEKPNNCNIVHHKDGDKTNNHYTNLEWTTQQNNILEQFERYSNIRNFDECLLYKNDILIGEFKNIKAACKEAKKLGGKFYSLYKYLKDKQGFKIVKKCNDYPKGE